MNTHFQSLLLYYWRIPKRPWRTPKCRRSRRCSMAVKYLLDDWLSSWVWAPPQCEWTGGKSVAAPSRSSGASSSAGSAPDSCYGRNRQFDCCPRSELKSPGSPDLFVLTPRSCSSPGLGLGSHQSTSEPVASDLRFQSFQKKIPSCNRTRSQT